MDDIELLGSAAIYFSLTWFVSSSLDECLDWREKQEPFPVSSDKSRLRIGAKYFSAGPI